MIYGFAIVAVVIITRLVLKYNIDARKYDIESSQNHCYRGGNQHNFGPRFSEKDRGVGFRMPDGSDSWSFRRHATLDVYQGDVCSWCGGYAVPILWKLNDIVGAPPPDGYEFTGEYRQAKKYEWHMLSDGRAYRSTMLEETACEYRILRPEKPKLPSGWEAVEYRIPVPGDWVVFCKGDQPTKVSSPMIKGEYWILRKPTEQKEITVKLMACEWEFVLEELKKWYGCSTTFDKILDQFGEQR
jgi:hypothetical protein